MNIYHYHLSITLSHVYTTGFYPLFQTYNGHLYDTPTPVSNYLVTFVHLVDTLSSSVPNVSFTPLFYIFYITTNTTTTTPTFITPTTPFTTNVSSPAPKYHVSPLFTRHHRTRSRNTTLT